jgi:MoaA/NifB/PqqE/SkfB family radical SAM enzyme
MRQDLLDGKKIAECKQCHNQEERHGISQRQVYNEYYFIKDNQDIGYYHNTVKKMKFDQLDKPLYVEMHVSNLCNLKCLTCNEWDSSQFHAENKILGISKHPGTNFTKFVVNTAKALEEVIHPGMLFLDIRGGETLLVPEVKKQLSDVAPDIAKNITLKIQTNGTIKPDTEWLEIFKKFKNTKINVSVDAYGDDNHYVRYPANWKDILDTIECIKSNGIKFIINTVVSNLNIMFLDKLLIWIQKNNYLNYLYILESPAHYSPTNLPDDCLEIAVSRLSKLPKKFENQNTAGSVDRLIDMCNNTIVGDDKNNLRWESFIKEVKMRDKQRGNCIVDVIPELRQFFIK